jgi:hypothetical protein
MLRDLTEIKRMLDDGSVGFDLIAKYPCIHNHPPSAESEEETCVTILPSPSGYLIPG